MEYDQAPAPAAKAPAEELALRAAHSAGQRVVWKELPGTAREQRQVAGLARTALKAQPVLRGGADASVAQLEEDLPRARWAHLATHGFFADPQFRSAFQVDEGQFRRLTWERQTAGARSLAHFLQLGQWRFLRGERALRRLRHPGGDGGQTLARPRVPRPARVSRP